MVMLVELKIRFFYLMQKIGVVSFVKFFKYLSNQSDSMKTKLTAVF